MFRETKTIFKPVLVGSSGAHGHRFACPNETPTMNEPMIIRDNPSDDWLQHHRFSEKPWFVTRFRSNPTGTHSRI
jgi:hypothetical protein